MTHQGSVVLDEIANASAATACARFFGVDGLAHGTGAVPTASDVLSAVWEAAQSAARSAILHAIGGAAGAWPNHSDARAVLDGVAMKIACMSLPGMPEAEH